ncbi:Quinone oxidoreductase 2 [Microbacterium lemovicicum]|uniref:Quinone oxidoreductase 2 n=1 Tax=Microbacterium lemovicicum TaxID=1072463 RepID=A0A3S9WE06_9MICO|nr:NAD(P)H-binding protein [Microbacterium lemovicicum]AZS38270.1 Quinone oxidoreductase 2 [Microbacterium lemovicicum]
MTMLITGATGHLGRLVIDSLLRRGVPADQIVAGARTPASAADLPVTVVEFDYDRPETLAPALQGVDTVLLISASVPGVRVPQHAAVIDAAAAAGVSRLIYTSVTRADTSELLLAGEHKMTEELIAASGIPSTILRNNWYHENQLASAQQAAAAGVLLSSSGDGRIASASRIDFAEAAAAVLTGTGHEGTVYELSGDTAWTAEDLAAAISDAAGSPVAVTHLSARDHAAALTAAGLDEGTVGFLTTLDANVAAGALDDDRSDLRDLIGRPTTPLAEVLRSAL